MGCNRGDLATNSGRRSIRPRIQKSVYIFGKKEYSTDLLLESLPDFLCVSLAGKSGFLAFYF